jgi:CheY-like chemotaxis protein
MPELDGWDTLRQLRADPKLADLPVVVFTADMSARGEAPDELREGDVLITKPFQADDLLHAVQTAIGAKSSGDVQGRAT